jgi:hypothetical protein
MKNKLIYISLGLLIASGAIIIASIKKRNKDDDKNNENNDNINSSDISIKNPKELFEKDFEEQGSTDLKKSEKITPTTLVIGSKGRPVGFIQAWLNYKYGANIKVDGRFGQQTRDALRDKLGFWCGSYGLGDKECTIKSSDKFVKDAFKAIKDDKNFLNYLKKVYTPVIKEYEPVEWGGIYFGIRK